MPSFEQMPSMPTPESMPSTELSRAIEKARREIRLAEDSINELMAHLLINMSEDRRKIYIACIKNLGRLQRFQDDLKNNPL
ncbi:hypothetical protein KKG46_01250 [Patescibacteria group bacterium]|nr:hypothetical protein [Patescibacteria group bacterium]